jgi:hypothetical protein
MRAVAGMAPLGVGLLMAMASLPVEAQETCANVIVETSGYVECIHIVGQPVVFVARATAQDTGINHEMLIEIVATNQESGASFEGASGWRDQADGSAKVEVSEPGLYSVTAMTKNMDGRADTLMITVEPYEW